jgi:hypothetical protein
LRRRPLQLYGQIGWLGSLQNEINIRCRPPIGIRQVETVRHESATQGVKAVRVHSRQTALCGHGNDCAVMQDRGGRREHGDRSVRLPRKSGDLTFDFGMMPVILPSGRAR